MILATIAPKFPIHRSLHARRPALADLKIRWNSVYKYWVKRVLKEKSQQKKSVFLL